MLVSELYTFDVSVKLNHILSMIKLHRIFLGSTDEHEALSSGSQ